MERITGIRLQLMLAQPFLASAIARLPLVDATALGWCDTAATDGYYIYVNLAFTATLSDDELRFVLAHELMHCVLGHPDRRGKRDRFRWNVAVDFATNAFLASCGFVPLASALYDRRYAGMTAETIYEGLPSTKSTFQAILSIRGKRGDDREPDAIRAPGFDMHLEATDTEGSAMRSKQFPSPEERHRLRTSLAAEMRSMLPGSTAGYRAEELLAGATYTVPWRELLARFVSTVRRSDYRLFPPNKKHLWRGIYMPSIGVPGPEHLVIAIDTSGSMSSAQLAQILGEVNALRAGFECRVTLLQCDVHIQRTDAFDPWADIALPTTPQQVHGRGGTDLRPPFEWVEKQMREEGQVPDAIIYCTDGYGPYPDAPPRDVPVLWVLTSDGVADVPFGDSIRLDRLGRE